MTDGLGRTIDYVRISVTDRCNLRCAYCMPEEGVPCIPHSQILRFEEILRICRILARNGIRKVKLTGGEPLVRRGILDLTAALKAVPGIENVTITTNGVLLEELYDGLADAGIDAITVSLDTLDPKLYQAITRRDEADRVRRGLEQAIQKGRVPLKINCVPLMDAERQGLLEVVELARAQKVHVRFIEMMPIGLGAGFPLLREEELRGFLESRLGPLTPCADVPGNGPCRYFAVEGFQGRLGFISAVSHRFCETCNRIRLTSDGYLKTCLQYDCGAALKPVLEAGGTDEELEARIRQALADKPKGHEFGKAAPFAGREEKGMSQIGG